MGKYSVSKNPSKCLGSPVVIEASLIRMIAYSKVRISGIMH